MVLSHPRLLVLVILALSSSMAAAELSPPDLTKGQIDGMTAMMALPVSGVTVNSGGASFARFLPAEGCEAHLAPFGDLEHERVYPCRQWFIPPEGRYRVWLEMPGMISDGFGVLTWEDEPFRGRGLAMSMGMEPAGRVALSRDVPLRDTESFRLVLLRGVLNGRLRNAFDRRTTEASARSGVAVAAAPVLAGIFDRKTGDALALARPGTVSPGKTAVVSPVPPKSGSDVMVVLARPRDAAIGKDEVSLTLDVDDKPHRPDAFLSSVERVIAVWYGVDGRKAVLRADSTTLRLPPITLALQPRKVTTYRGKLATLPSIGVSILAPEPEAETKMAVEVRRDGVTEPLARMDVVPNREYRFDAVPAETLKVVLAVSEWEIERRVDLTSGADESVVFDLDPIHVWGTVHHGRDPAPYAHVAFQGDRDWVRTVADEAGRYELTFWKPLETIAEVTLRDRDGPPLIDGPFDVKDSRTVDFHVPRTRFEVDVHDVSTGEPIAGARVLAGSIYAAARGEQNVLQTAFTNADGRAALPPMREGAMVVRVRADGYFDSDPVETRVTRIDDEARYTIALRPIGPALHAEVRLPDGRPAVAAAVWAVVSVSGQQPPLWTGRTDTKGGIEIPRDVRDALFLIRADGAASAVRRFSETWALGAPAPVALRLDKPARLAVWIDGFRVSGVPLALVTGSLEATDSSGFWSAGALPAGPLRVLAWRSSPIDAGAHDVVATTVPYPWPPVVDLKSVD